MDPSCRQGAGRSLCRLKAPDPGFEPWGCPPLRTPPPRPHHQPRTHVGNPGGNRVPTEEVAPNLRVMRDVGPNDVVRHADSWRRSWAVSAGSHNIAPLAPLVEAMTPIPSSGPAIWPSVAKRTSGPPQPRTVAAARGVPGAAAHRHRLSRCRRDVLRGPVQHHSRRRRGHLSRPGDLRRWRAE